MLNKIKIAGGTGTKEDPIVIIADDEFTGVSSEYDYLENILGEQNVVWRLQEQMLMISKNKYYDVLNIELRNGEQRSYWFDITSFYGEGEKMNKYIFLLAILLNSKSRSKKHYSPDVVISDLFDTDLDEIDL